MRPDWNISLFHYRNHGADYGRAFPRGHAGTLLIDQTAFGDFLSELGYRHWPKPRTPPIDSSSVAEGAFDGRLDRAMLQHRNRLLIPLQITVLSLFAASGGDSNDGDNDAPAETAADAGDTATTQPDDGASVEAFCSTKAESDALFNEADPFDPVSLEAAFLANVGLMDAALQNIPAEIEDDLRVVRQSMDDYIDVLEANDWDFFAASSAIEEIEGPELEAAEARLETWEVANCSPKTETTSRTPRRRSFLRS